MSEAPDPDDVGDCETCGKFVGYGRIDGLCGPCHMRAMSDDMGETTEDAGNYDQCGAMRRNAKWVGTFYTLAFLTLALAWWFL